MSADGNVLAVNAGIGSGDSIVKIFEFSANTWSAVSSVTPFTAGSARQFGSALQASHDGSILVVGENQNNFDPAGAAGNSALPGGAAYVFQLSGGVWNRTAFIKPAALTANEFFGASVSISNDGKAIAVGSPHTFEDNVAGAVTVFRNTGSAWVQDAHIADPALNVGNNHYATSVSLSGDGRRLAVGIYGDDSLPGGAPGSTGATDSGAVYVY